MSVESGSSDGFEDLYVTPSPEKPGTPLLSASLFDGPTSSISSAAWDPDVAKHSIDFGYAYNSSLRIEIAATSDSNLGSLWSSTTTYPEINPRGNLLVVRLAKTTPEALPPSLQSMLETLGWIIT